MIRVVYQGVRQAMHSASDNSWALHCLKHFSWRSRSLSCAYLNGECQFHAKSNELIVAFWLAPLTENEIACLLNVVIATRWMPSAAAWLPDKCTRLADSLQQTIDVSMFQTLAANSFNSLRAPYPITDRFLKNQNRILWIFMILFNFYWYLRLDSFRR